MTLRLQRMGGGLAVKSYFCVKPNFLVELWLGWGCDNILTLSSPHHKQVSAIYIVLQVLKLFFLVMSVNPPFTYCLFI